METSTDNFCHLSLDEIGLKYIGENNSANSKKYIGGDKTSVGQNFTEHYDKILCHLRLSDIKFMEIGIFNGKSIAMWADYFKNGTIYGIDINLSIFKRYLETLRIAGAFTDRKITFIEKGNPNNKSYYPNGDIKVIEYDTSSPEFTKIVHEELGEFNVIVDDGNHTANYQYHNFELLFDYLKPGGIYIIEDIDEPNKLFDFYKFGYIINGLAHIKNASINNIKNEYIKKHKQDYIKMNEKLIELNSHLENKLIKETNEDNLNKLNEKQISLKQKISFNESNAHMFTTESLNKQFNDIIERKKHLINLIDRIEIKSNNLIIYRK